EPGSEKSPTPTGRMDRERRQPPDRAGRRQPHLAISFRKGHRKNAQRFRRDRRSSEPSRIARLARDRICEARLELEGDAPSAPARERLPAIEPARRTGRGERPRKPPALAHEPAPPGS